MLHLMFKPNASLNVQLHTFYNNSVSSHETGPRVKGDKPVVRLGKIASKTNRFPTPSTDEVISKIIIV